MTGDELIAQLRDIHLPPVTDNSTILDFALWPIAVFMLIWAVVLGVRFWRRNAWRRDARAALRRIESNSNRAEQWAALLDLAVRIAHIRGQATPLPEFAYCHPDRVDDADTLVLVQHIRTDASR